jgi:hypothetical protein
VVEGIGIHWCYNTAYYTDWVWNGLVRALFLPWREKGVNRVGIGEFAGFIYQFQDFVNAWTFTCIFIWR